MLEIWAHDVMEKLIVKYLVPLLLVVLAIAMFVDFQTVETIDPKAGRYEPAVREPQSVPPQPQRFEPRGETRLALGERYASLQDLVADQQAAGYLRTGYFGKHWPATVIEIRTDHDGISFVRQNGTRHNYTGFGGYRMKVVRLSGPGEQETLVVFRSANKR